MNQLSQEILQRLDALAAKIGTTVQLLWSVLVRQAIVQGYENLAYSVVGLVVLAICLPKLYKFSLLLAENQRTEKLYDIAYEKWWEDYSYKDRAQRPDKPTFAAINYPLLVTCTAISVIALIVTGCSIHDCVTQLFNPQYWALQNLFQILHQ